MREQRKLLILGLLNITDMHGYMLNAHLEMNVPISLKKPTAYSILEILEQEKLISSTEKSTGNRKRKVFALTEAGKLEYTKLLKLQLSEFIPGEFPSMVSLNFIDDIPKNEALSLLNERLIKIEEFANKFNFNDMYTSKNHSGSSFLSFEFSRRVINLEKEFIKEIVQHLEE